ncbi:L,D-transpeptidase family protein [Bradyrhizobium sp. dw_411]|uniref:L,D-transpeptidase family protein n=1 Tax=Bradyrhizobium sp. dw_411 TaxID=2720082 RepID=UPI001BCC3624|nr:L,D-transpeptidase family protein [Bradyrhizobium sp. dw_411]
MTRVNGHKAAVATGRVWRVAVLTAASAIGVTSQAEAALYWPGSEPGLSQPDPAAQPRKPKARRNAAKKNEMPEKESSKPQGPVIISISIDQQKMRIYDANGLFAETPVSTGMRGHPTPMGVFSVIQKDRLHHSNIYSGAPMPYMQRITWSGIAIHAGVLPGYPASHGCIRMPMAFAMKMWTWTRMGARVVVTPGEMTPPASFAHPLLAAVKVAPQPMVADEPKSDAPSAAKTDKGAEADTKTKPAIAEAPVELRSTIGHANSVTEPTRTADASNSLPVSNAPTMSDAGSGATPAAETAVAQPEPDAAKSGDIASSEDKSTEAKSADVTPPKTATAEIKAEESANAEAVKVETTKVDAAASEAAKMDEPKAETKTAEVKAADVRSEAPKADAAKSIEKPTGSKIAAEAAIVPPARKDQGRLSGLEKAAAVKPEAPKRSGQIAVFVSRKDSKLYVRQNFLPLFEAPVTIAPSDRPLGTHVFTAQVDKENANVLHWSVVTMPASRAAERRDEDERSSRRRKIAGAVEVKSLPAPDSPAEALDRLNLPAEALARITEALSTGGSLIVSDQGIAGGETGEGTDFIVSLR